MYNQDNSKIVVNATMSLAQLPSIGLIKSITSHTFLYFIASSQTQYLIFQNSSSVDTASFWDTLFPGVLYQSIHISTIYAGQVIYIDSHLQMEQFDQKVVSAP